MPPEPLDTWTIETETLAGAPVTIAYTSGGIEAAPAEYLDLISRRVARGDWVTLAPAGPAAPPTTTGPGWAVFATVIDALAPVCNLRNLQIDGTLPTIPADPEPLDLLG